MKKSLAKVITLGLLTASVFVVNGYDNKCLAGDTWWNGVRIEQVVVENKDVADSQVGLQDPEIQHKVNGATYHDESKCEENANKLDIKDIAQIKDTLVDNDKKLEQKIDGVKDTVISDIKEDESLKAELKGDKGDKGDTGAKGDKGDKGDTGAKGDKGDKGDTGAKGDKGDKGDTGAKGDKGDKGDTGADGKDGASIASGKYTVAGGSVSMDIKYADGTDAGQVIINDVASNSDLQKVQEEIGNYTDRGQHKIFGTEPININQALDKLATGAETEAKVREDADIKLSNEIKDEIKAREDADKAGDVKSASYDKESGTLTLKNEAGEQLAQATDIASKEKLETEVSERQAEDKRIEQKFDKEVSRLDSKIDKLDDRVEKVGAMAAAMASLHTMGYDPAAPTEIAVGVGQYRDKTGLALGAFHYPNKNFILNVSVSTAGDEFMAGIGATWKIGRRSPEQMLKAEQEKAARQKLAKAEAEKKAAKDARVAAQAAKHAKMLAERGL